MNKPVGNEQLKPEPPERIWIDQNRKLKWTDYKFDGGVEYIRASAPAQGDVISRAEIGKDLRQMVNGWRTEAARLQLKADSKGVSRHINTEAQAVEIEYGLTTKAEGYRLCAIALENMLNWHGIEKIDNHELPATSTQATHPDMPRRWCSVHNKEEFKYESYEHEFKSRDSQYELGRHDERQRTMQLIGGVRMDAQTGANGDVLDRLVMNIVAEPLPDIRSTQATPDAREGWQECISRFDDTLNS